MAIYKLTPRGPDFTRCPHCGMSVVATPANASLHLARRCDPRQARRLRAWAAGKGIRDPDDWVECSRCGAATRNMGVRATGRCDKCDREYGDRAQQRLMPVEPARREAGQVGAWEATFVRGTFKRRKRA